MTKANRLIRAIHAGIVFWLISSLLGLSAVTLMQLFPKLMPKGFILVDQSLNGLLLHHLIPIVIVNFIIVFGPFVAIVKLLLEYQHELDLREKADEHK